VDSINVAEVFSIKLLTTPPKALWVANADCPYRNLSDSVNISTSTGVISVSSLMIKKETIPILFFHPALAV